VIDAEKYYRGKDVFKLVNTSKLASPLIVIDPVQKDRNAAAALSIEKFEHFKKAAGEFLKNPSKDFFIKRDLKSEFLKQKNKNRKLIAVELKPLSGKTDVVGSKLLKIYELMKEELKKHDFEAIKADWEWDKKNDAVLYFLFDSKPLPKNIEIGGPPVKMAQHAGNFRKKHKKTFIKNGKVFAAEQRKFTAPEDILDSLVKTQFTRERSKSSKIKIL